MTILKITCDRADIDTIEINLPFQDLSQKSLNRYLVDWYNSRNPNNEVPLHYFKIKEQK